MTFILNSFLFSSEIPLNSRWNKWAVVFTSASKLLQVGGDIKNVMANGVNNGYFIDDICEDDEYLLCANIP